MFTAVVLWLGLSAAQAAPEAVVPIGPPLRQMALELPADVGDALRERRWPDALRGLQEMDPDAMPGGEKGDWAFLLAWCATHAEGAEGVVDRLPWMDGAQTVPAMYAAVVRGEALVAAGEPLAALTFLDGVTEDAVMYPRAALVAAEALRALGRTKEAWERVERLIERPDPAEGNAEALWSLAQHRGLPSESSRTLLWRLWAHYPLTEQGRAAAGHVAKVGNAAPDWTWRVRRGESLMNGNAYVAALRETESVVAHQSDGTEEGCRLRYTRGRSEYKRNRITAASTLLSGIGAQCEGIAGSYGPRGQYLLGTALYRLKRFRSSADAYNDLATRFADHSMADDAWTRGGISLLEAGAPDEAKEWFETALADHPDGDTVPEATLRLAFAHYDAGEPTKAVEIAERLAALPRREDATHVDAGQYWAARWRLYPDAEAPNTAVTDPEVVKDVLDRWRTLCEEHPDSFYAILAYSRLKELAPDVASVLAERPAGHEDGSKMVPWQVRVSVAADPAMRNGVALARLGLVSEALAEWRQLDWGALLPDEKAWTTELRIAAGDWLFAHDELRAWLHTHPAGSLGEQEPQVIRLAYPDRYWEEVKGAVPEAYRYEPRLFHALVREESNFNRHIVSFAGAIGLSQLMWATAQQTAGWLGMRVTRTALNDPATNLVIGGRYLDAMHRQLSDSPYLALAAYNGGARNVTSWVETYGNPPIDELVERIPFRETRGYVKRVMGTWQLMRYRFDHVDAFPDLSAFNHSALP